MADGLYHFPTLINQLRKTGYRHFISIEDFRQVAPEEILQDAITYLLSLEHA
jgi:sugar phosphate isomerase/epimerase